MGTEDIATSFHYIKHLLETFTRLVVPTCGHVPSKSPLHLTKARIRAARVVRVLEDPDVN